MRFHKWQNMRSLEAKADSASSTPTEEAPIAVKTHIWIAVCVYLMVAIIYKQMELPRTLKLLSSPGAKQIVIFCLGLFLTASPSLYGEEKMNAVKIGWASRDISTDKPIGILGQMYLRISTGILDPVTLTALTIDNGSDSVVFLSVDCIVIHSDLVKAIRNKVKTLDPSIPANKIIMNATHTHTSGDFYVGFSDFPGDVDVPRMPGKEYFDFVVAQAADAIVEAWKNRRSGGVAWGYGYAVVGQQRRALFFEDSGKDKEVSGTAKAARRGKAVMYGNTNSPKFGGYETGADPFVNLLYTFDENNKLTGTIINIPAPSQSSENRSKLSADYWNEVRIGLKKEYGDIHILPQCAAAGDLSPRILHYKKAEARRFKLKYGLKESKDMAERKDIAERISSAFTETLAWAKKDIRTNLPIKHISETIDLPRMRITKEQYEAELRTLDILSKREPQKDGTPLERLQADSGAAITRVIGGLIVDRYKTQDAEPNLPMELHVVKIGDIAFASNRFELFMDYMHMIQARSPFEQTFIIQLAGSEVGDNEFITYLPTQRAVENGGYGAVHHSSCVGPEGGKKLVDETVKILNKL